MVYFIATPIGNLKDISLRALEVLRGCDCVFCEDTRHSLKLLNHYEIKKPAVRLPSIQRAGGGGQIDPRSPARANRSPSSPTPGTPVISDPGNVLASAMREAGVNLR